MKWENINPQVDTTEALQQSGTYLGYTLFLSLCKNSHLATRIGREILPSSCRAHISVRQSGFKDWGLGLFSATRFTENDIVTIYFAPITTKEIPKEKNTQFLGTDCTILFCSQKMAYLHITQVHTSLMMLPGNARRLVLSTSNAETIAIGMDL